VAPHGASTALTIDHEAEYDESGHLVGRGLTLHPTVHQLLLEERPFSTWCAPDTLGVPVVLRHSARIRSTCPDTGASIEVTLTPEHLESLSPASAVVSFMQQRNRLKCKETSGIRQECCNHQLFFAFQEGAAPWAVSHADFIVLPVEEAFVGLRDFARRQLVRATRA
jgi:alkylmercury lyase